MSAKQRKKSKEARSPKEVITEVVDKGKQGVIKGAKALAKGSNLAIRLAKIARFLNDPEWYTNLDMHTKFTIPFNYTDDQIIPYGSGLDKQSLVVYDVAYNPMAQPVMRSQRADQMMSLLKGMNKLSGLLPYSAVNLAHYEDLVYYVVNEYYRLKFLLKLSRYYTPSKPSMPAQALRYLGVDPQDFLKNRSLYVSMLVEIANFITNNVPVYGQFVERIAGNWKCLVPDSNDLKVASLIKVNYHFSVPVALGDTDLGANNVYGDMFEAITWDNSDKSITVQNDYNQRVTYDTYYGNWVEFKNEFLGAEYVVTSAKTTNSQLIGAIKADIIGAFGSESTWEDLSINEVEDIAPKIVGPFDELYLTQIQNSTVCGSKFTLRLSDNAIVEPNQLLFRIRANYDSFDTKENAFSDRKRNGIYSNMRVDIAYDKQTEANMADIALPPVENFMGATTSSKGFVDDDRFANGIGVIANSENLDEGQELEIIQNKAIVTDVSLFEDSTALTAIYTMFTSSMFVMSAHSISAPNGIVTLVNLSNRNLTLPTTEHQLVLINTASDTINMCQAWSQIDYSPALAIQTVRTQGGAFKIVSNNVLLDWNVMGSVSYANLQSAFALSAYSLHSINMTIKDTRKINNIVTVYQ